MTCKVVTKLVKPVVLYNLTGDPNLANQWKPPEILDDGKPNGKLKKLFFLTKRSIIDNTLPRSENKHFEQILIKYFFDKIFDTNDGECFIVSRRLDRRHSLLQF